MHRLNLGVLCLIAMLASTAYGQSSSIEPIHAAAGTVLAFHLQTRLKPVDGDALDALPKGTVLRVKMLDSIDSRVDRDGAEFHGSIVTPVRSRGVVVVPSGAEVEGLLALLRSKRHPDGFRYELLITGLTDEGKSYAITASLHPSLVDGEARDGSGTKAPKQNSERSGASDAKPTGTVRK